MLDAGNTKASVFLVAGAPAARSALVPVLHAAGLAPQTFASAQDFLDSEADAAPACLVVDLAGPGSEGLALQHALAARASLLPLVFLSRDADVATAVAAMKAGAFDVLTEPVDAAQLVAAVAAALAHSRALHAAQAQRLQARALVNSLSPREREVLALLVDGKLNKQVAAALGTVEKTVKAQRASVMHKTGAASFAALVRLWDAAHAPALAWPRPAVLDSGAGAGAGAGIDAPSGRFACFDGPACKADGPATALAAPWRTP